MRKILCFLLAIVMIFSLAACGYNPFPPATELPTQAPTTVPEDDILAPGEPGKVPGKVQSAIDTAMGHTVDLYGGTYRYYGTYNGYIILFEKIISKDIRPINIGNYVFVDPIGTIMLYAISNDEVTKLGYVYEKGQITAEQLELIYDIHAAYYEESEYDALVSEYRWYYITRQSQHPNEYELTYQVENAINAAFQDGKGRRMLIDWVNSRYYGKVGGYHIVFEQGQAGDCPIEVGPFTFHHNYSHTIYILKDGQLIRLQDAYDQGLLTLENVEKIYTVHRSYYGATYSQWEQEDSQNSALQAQYATLLQGLWETDCYYITGIGEQEPAYPDGESYGFQTDGSGYYAYYSTKYLMQFSIIGAVDNAIVIAMDRNSQGFVCFYYVTDSVSPYYQCLIRRFENADEYAILRRTATSVDTLVPSGVQMWEGVISSAIGTWRISPESDWTVDIRYDGVYYTLILDYYGRVISCTPGEEHVRADENRDDLIGWRAARDICLEMVGLKLEDMTHLNISFEYSASVSARYTVCVQPGIQMQFDAKNGHNTNGALPGTAILTKNQITAIALEELDDEILQAYLDGRAEMKSMVVYTGGAAQSNPQFVYEWSLTVDTVTYSYRVDAFTGQIVE